jgi:hypothetical protein
MPKLNPWLIRLAVIAASVACAGWKWDGGAAF